MLDIILVSIALIGIIIGSITDIQKREVADWVNYSMLFAGLGIRMLHSAYTGEWYVLLAGIIGAALMFGIGAAMYYSGQWGGGDAKMLMALGGLMATYQPIALLNFAPQFGQSFFIGPHVQMLPFLQHTTVLFPIAFFVNTMLAGAVYGIVWSLVKTTVKFRSVIAAYKEVKDQKVKMLLVYRLSALALLLVAVYMIIQTERKLFAIPVLLMAVMLYMFKYITLAARAMEYGTMRYSMSPQKLTEGEWVLENVHIGGKKIADKDTNLTLKQLKQLDTKAEHKITVKKTIGFKQIPIYKFEEHQKLAHPYKTLNGKIIKVGPLNKNDMYTIMQDKIAELSKTIKVKRNGKEEIVHFSELQVDDTLLEDLYNDRLTIITKENLGIDRYQIDLIQKLHKKDVMVKIGIPFIPAFLLGFLVTLVWGLPLLLLF